jgi:hypothetical protein
MPCPTPAFADAIKPRKDAYWSCDVATREAVDDQKVVDRNRIKERESRMFVSVDQAIDIKAGQGKSCPKP